MNGGRFLTFEGIEGAGKSTLAGALAAVLRERGEEVVQTFEPGATALGRRLRELLLHQTDTAIDARAELFLYLADRAQHVEAVIRPALEREAWVLCDRFTDATVAYQGYGRGLDREQLEPACSWAAGLEPHRTFLLDLEVSRGLARAGRVGAHDRIEREAAVFHERVRSGYLAIAAAEPHRVRVLDGDRSPEELLAEVVADLDGSHG